MKYEEKEMKNKVIRRAGLWMFCTVVLAGLGYATAVLSAEPAYASGPVCEAEDCTLVRQLVTNICQTRGGILLFSCSSASDNWSFVCGDHATGNGTCSTYPD